MSNIIPHSDRRVTYLPGYEELSFWRWMNDKINRHLREGRAMDGVRVRKCEYVAIIRDSREGLT